MTEEKKKKPRRLIEPENLNIIGQYARNPNPKGLPFKTPVAGEKIDPNSLRRMEDIKRPNTQDRIIKNTVAIAANILGDEAVKKALADGTFSEELKKIEKDLQDQYTDTLKTAKEAKEFLKGKDPKELEKTRDKNDEETNQALDAIKANKSLEDNMVYVGSYRHMEHKGISGLSPEELQQKNSEAFENLPPRKIKEITVTDKDLEELQKKDPKDLTAQELKIVLDKGEKLEIGYKSNLEKLLIEKGKTDGAGDKGNAVVGKPNKGMVEDREIDPIKEDDIINYMYNEWILKFANYSVKKGFHVIDYTTDWAERQILFGNRNLDKNTDHVTPTLLKKFEKNFKDDMAKNEGTRYDGKNWRKTSEAIRKGEFDKLPISERSFEFLKTMSEEDRGKYFSSDRTEKNIQDMNHLNKRVLAISTVYAAAQIFNKQAQGELNMSADENLKSLFKQEKEAAKTNIYKWMSKYTREHPLNENTMEEMYNTIQHMEDDSRKGYEDASKQVANGKYKDNNDPKNPYKTPDALKKMENIFASVADEKTGIWEATIGDRDAEAFLRLTATNQSNKIKNQEGETIQYGETKDVDYNRIERICEANGFPKREVRKPEPNTTGQSKFDFTKVDRDNTH